MQGNGRLLVDSYGRQIATLRVSLTEHCNFRCVYCMPPEGLPFQDKSTYLTIEEIVRFVRLVSTRGVRRVRLTGGEPLLRKDIVEIVEALAAVEDVDELSITTNASRLAELAQPLRRAGLDRINVSLDSVDPQRFARVTRADQYERVMRGIDTAIEAGFPLKINVVVLNTMPPDEIVEFARLAAASDVDVRFLEFMPLCGSGWDGDLVFPIARVRDIVREHFGLEELPRGDRPAQTFSIVGGRGRVGFIASLSEPFCDTCSRMRLTADGNIRPCLFSNYEVPVGRLLKQRASDEVLLEAIHCAVWNKPWGSEFMERPFDSAETAGREVTPAPFIRNIGG